MYRFSLISAARAAAFCGVMLFFLLENSCTKDPATTYDNVVSGNCVQLTAPADQSTNVATRPLFSWTSSCTNATSYEIQYSYDPVFPAATTQYSYVSGTTYQVPLTDAPLTLNYVYYWRVRSKSGSGVGDWSHVSKFTVSSTSCLQLVSPISMATSVSARPLFTWTASSCLPALNTFELQYSTDANFAAGVATKDTVVSGNSYQIPYTTKPLPYSSVYYWRVRSKDGNTTGGWSAANKFTTQTFCLNLVAPSQGYVAPTTDIKLVWQSACVGTDTFQVSLEGKTNNVTKGFFVRGDSLSLSAANVLGSSQTYNWRVRGVHYHDTTAWTAYRTFTTPDLRLQIVGNYTAVCTDHIFGTGMGSMGYYSYSTYTPVVGTRSVVVQNSNTVSGGIYFNETGSSYASDFAPDMLGNYYLYPYGNIGYPDAWFFKGINHDSFEVHITRCSGSPSHSGCSERIYKGKR